MPLHVINHQQHGPGRNRYRPGAVHDVDGDGVREDWEQEHNLTPFVILGVREALAAAGHLHTVVDDQVEARKAGQWPTGYPYGAQHDTANRYATDHEGVWTVYLAHHLNSSTRGGSYGSFLYVRGSTQGEALSHRLAGAMEGRPGVPQAHARACYDDRHHKDGRGKWVTAEGKTAWLYNAHATIRGTFDGPGNVCGVCCEPRFIQSLSGDVLNVAEVLKADGRAMGRAIVAWYDSVSGD